MQYGQSFSLYRLTKHKAQVCALWSGKLPGTAQYDVVHYKEDDLHILIAIIYGITSDGRSEALMESHHKDGFVEALESL
jgi:hypothetical protein